jgi:hypothetical protein
MWLTICNDIEPGQLGVSGGREHGADRKAWVARLATPVDGVSVVAPTFDRVWMVPAKGLPGERTDLEDRPTSLIPERPDHPSHDHVMMPSRIK